MKSERDTASFPQPIVCNFSLSNIQDLVVCHNGRLGYVMWLLWASSPVLSLAAHYSPTLGITVGGISVEGSAFATQHHTSTSNYLYMYHIVKNAREGEYPDRCYSWTQAPSTIAPRKGCREP